MSNLHIRRDVATLYKHHRRAGRSPRVAIWMARLVQTSDSWERAAHTIAYGEGGAEMYTWNGPHLPDGPVREALTALDAALDRWSLRVEAVPDWDFEEGAEGEAKNAGVAAWWAPEDPDDVEDLLAESWARGCGDADPRPHGGHVHYADTGLTRRGRYSTAKLYLYYTPKNANAYFKAKGEARGCAHFAARARAGVHVEAFARYLGTKYAERGGYAPLSLLVAVCWDGEVVGEASCGGFSPDVESTSPVIDAMLSSDMLFEALHQAETWTSTVAHQRRAAAERAVREAVEACARLGADAAYGADNPKRRFPAAAYSAA